MLHIDGSTNHFAVITNIDSFFKKN